MPQTPRGITYPDSGGSTRLWEHLANLAETADAAIGAGVTIESQVLVADGVAWSATSGADAYRFTFPGGQRWVYLAIRLNRSGGTYGSTVVATGIVLPAGWRPTGTLWSPGYATRSGTAIYQYQLGADGALGGAVTVASGVSLFGQLFYPAA